MKLIHLSHRIPYPPDKGDKIRAFHQIRHLAERHELHVYTLVDDPDDWRQVEELERICASVHAFPLSGWSARLRAAAALTTGRPFSPAYFHQPELVRALRTELAAGDTDAVIVFCSAMMAALPESLETPILADYCDLDSAKWDAYTDEVGWPRRWLWAAEARRLARFEVERGSAAEAVVFATPLEAEDFGALPSSSGVDVRVIANGVDLESFRADERSPAEEPTVVFTGAMDYRPNHEGAAWFIESVWDRVLERIPTARLHVVGRNPPPRLRAHDGARNIRVTGTVPKVQPWLQEAWVSVAPLQIARGVQNKVLEAMASGVPTLISPAVSRGLEARTGIETIVVDGEAEWAASVVRLLQNPELRRGLSGAARRYVHDHHDWQAHGMAWERLLAGTDQTLRGVA